MPLKGISFKCNKINKKVNYCQSNNQMNQNTNKCNLKLGRMKLIIDVKRLIFISFLIINI